MTKDKTVGRKSSAAMRSLILGSSLGALAVIGTPTIALSQVTTMEEACAAVLTLKNPAIIETLIEKFRYSPCIPLLLTALPPRILTSLDQKVVATLPESQLHLVPATVLEQLGLNPKLGIQDRSISYNSQSNNNTQSTDNRPSTHNSNQY